ncbi:MAG: transketolase C-terminal domain-containing protein, partial [Pseudomonadota bacterium]
RHMMATSLAYDAGPSAVRFPRGAGVGVDLPDRGEILPIGKGRIVRQGEDVAILSLGAHLNECLGAADLLVEQGHNPTVADARFAKPLDSELLKELAATHSAIVTVEQGAQGGFGAHVLSHLANSGALDRGLRVRTVTLPDRFIDQASPGEMYADAAMTAQDIERLVGGLLRREDNVIEMSIRRP